MFRQKLVLAGVILLVTACVTQKTDSQKPDPQLDAKVAAESPAPTAQAIAERGAQTFINAPGLSDDQKQKLLGIFVKVYDEAIAIKNDIGKSKSLLFKLVASKDYKSKEVEDLKKRIVALDQKRLRIMFKALADVQEVVGTGEEKEEIYKHFYDFEYPKSTYSQR